MRDIYSAVALPVSPTWRCMGLAGARSSTLRALPVLFSGDPAACDDWYVGDAVAPVFPTPASEYAEACGKDELPGDRTITRLSCAVTGLPCSARTSRMLQPSVAPVGSARAPTPTAPSSTTVPATTPRWCDFADPDFTEENELFGSREGDLPAVGDGVTLCTLLEECGVPDGVRGFGMLVGVVDLGAGTAALATSVAVGSRGIPGASAGTAWGL